MESNSRIRENMSFRQTIIFVLIAAGCLWGVTLQAQKKGAKKTPPTKTKPKSADTVAIKKAIRNFLPDIYLGSGGFKGGEIKKSRFDSLLKVGLNSHDSLGNNYKVLGFNFIYAERVVYEDSMANLQVITDYLFEYCPGDTVSHGIINALAERSKAGDTVFFDKVSVARLRGDVPDSISILGRPVKCVIVK